MRVVLGAGAGLALVEAGRRFSRRGLRLYGQMLAGGGVVVLYLAVYAALNFYALVSVPAAFVLMAGVTVLAATRADAERSQPLALLAVSGGFLTPFLVGGDTDAQHVLFGYDALLVLGTLWLARRHRWPLLHLVGFALTAQTFLAWAASHYTAGRWLATELWLTAFAVLFVAIWRTIPPGSTDLAQQLAWAALAFTPFFYHAASLAILWRHTVGFLVYVIATTVLGLIVAGQARRPWLRVATWALVSLPALGWLSMRPARWDVALFVTLFGIYALHLVAHLRETLAHDETPRGADLFLLHANGLWLWAGLALLFEKLALSRLGDMTFLLAAWYALLATGARPRNRDTALHALALALALLAAAIVIEYDGAAVTAAWAVEGAAIAALGLGAGRPWMRVGGLGLLGASLVRLGNDLAGPALAASLPLINVRALTTWLVVALLAWLAWQYRRQEPQRLALPPAGVVAALVIVAAVLVLGWATSEVHAVFARAAWTGAGRRGLGAVTAATLARNVSVSTLWAAYALLLVAVGIRRRYRPLRVLAIAIFGVTVCKVFVADLARLDRFYRILSTVALGLLLLGASYLYQRFTRDERATS
jgi:uncharacterized membrane protein